MSNLDTVIANLRKRRIKNAALSAVDIAQTQFVLTIPGDCVATRSGRGFTSIRQLESLRRDLEKTARIQIDYIIQESRLGVILSEALSRTFSLTFPGVVDEVSVSLPYVNPVWVWVESSRVDSERPPTSRLAQKAAEVFRVFGIAPPSVAYSDSTRHPSVGPMLILVKVLSPVNPATLSNELQSRGEPGSTAASVGQRLEALRQKGLLVRNGNGTYALTELGLEIAPYTTRRQSSDVARALALARRVW